MLLCIPLSPFTLSATGSFESYFHNRERGNGNDYRRSPTENLANVHGGEPAYASYALPRDEKQVGRSVSWPS